jgi:hypothetical protein
LLYCSFVYWETADLDTVVFLGPVRCELLILNRTASSIACLEGLSTKSCNCNLKVGSS